MTGIEIIGLIASLTQLVDLSVKLSGALTKFQQRLNGEPARIKDYQSQLKHLASTATLITQNHDLHTSVIHGHVQDTVTRMKALDILVNDLERIDAQRIIKRYWRALTGWKEKEIAAAFSRLERDKTALVLCITGTNSGLLRDINERLKSQLNVIVGIGHPLSLPDPSIDTDGVSAHLSLSTLNDHKRICPLQTSSSTLSMDTVSSSLDTASSQVFAPRKLIKKMGQNGPDKVANAPVKDHSECKRIHRHLAMPFGKSKGIVSDQGSDALRESKNVRKDSLLRNDRSERDVCEDDAGESISDGSSGDESLFSGKSHSISSKSSLSGSLRKMSREGNEKGIGSSYLTGKRLEEENTVREGPGDSTPKKSVRKRSTSKDANAMQYARSTFTSKSKTSKPCNRESGTDNPTANISGTKKNSANRASTYRSSHSSVVPDRKASHWSRHDRENLETTASTTPRLCRYDGDAAYGDIECSEYAQQHNGFTTYSSDKAVIEALSKAQYRCIRARGRTVQENGGIAYDGATIRWFQ